MHKQGRAVRRQLPGFTAVLYVGVLCVGVLLLALALTWWAPKDDNSDAWAYHYYSGALLLDNRMAADYFAASSQSYLNPLVQVPFSAMVKAGWQDRWVATVMALYSGLALVLVVLFYRCALQLRDGALAAAVLMSVLFFVVWTCVGTSVPDLFLQIPVFLALLFLFLASSSNRYGGLYWAACLLGVALGLKLSAIIYVPGFSLLFLLRLWRGQSSFLQLLLSAVCAVAGFILVYGWWGWALYQKFGNPFFPFFNEWFQSPHFGVEPLSNKRFISASWMQQLLLPFRMALSDVFTYMEIRAPDLRPAAFVLAVVLLLLRAFNVRKLARNLIASHEKDFLIFLSVSLLVWVLISGNGRYAVGILVLLGGGLLVALRAALPLPWFRGAFLLVLLLQAGVIFQQVSIDPVPFRMRDTAWGGQWFNVDFKPVLGAGKQLVLSGTRSPLSVLEKDMGPDSSLINVSGIFALDDNDEIQKRISRYQGRILGMMMAGPDVAMNQAWVDKIYFEQFARFGLHVSAVERCRVVPKVEQNGKVGANFIFCPMERDSHVAERYMALTEKARQYFSRIETICPTLFAPRMNAVLLSDETKTKYYANYEIDVYVAKDDSVVAKKQWSMMMLSLGNVSDAYTLAPDVWRERYCEKLRRMRAMSQE